MARQNAPFEIEEVKQLVLIATLPTHYGEPPPLKFLEDVVTLAKNHEPFFNGIDP